MNFISNKDKDYFIENLSILISSSVNISEALNIIYIGFKNKALKKKILFVKQQVDSGFNFWQSLDEAKIFSQRDISLIKIGESSGYLAENLKILSDQHKKERMFKSRVSSALLYPAIVLFMALFIGIGMSWFLLPKLALIFSQLDIELPTLTKVMIAAGLFIQDYGTIFFPAISIIIIALFYLFFVNKKTKFIGQSFLFSFFITKKLIIESELSRLGFVLGVLLKAGFNITEALKTIEDSSSFWYYKKIYSHLLKEISEGKSIQESMASYKNLGRYIPLPVQQIIYVGEKSGKLSESLINVGQRYEERLDLTAKNLTVALEPILLIIVWLGVVFLALSIIMPVYNLISQIN